MILKVKPTGFLIVILVITMVSLSVIRAVHAESRDNFTLGERIFKSHCSSCHPLGLNVHNSKKPVKGSKTLVTLATFKNYLSNPMGHMPYYPHVIESEDMLKALYQYVKTIK
ncbi:MAG: cytochrome c [Candidatus Melainabacteria bacterium]|nr:cytochrome c [Candidatus Melainabacteria bacterium]